MDFQAQYQQKLTTADEGEIVRRAGETVSRYLGRF